MWLEKFLKIFLFNSQEYWYGAWKLIWKPVVISEWFPTPDHHHDPHDHQGHHLDLEQQHHGWDRSDEDTSQSKGIWKRDSDSSSTSNTQSAIDQPSKAAPPQARLLTSSNS